MFDSEEYYLFGDFISASVSKLLAFVNILLLKGATTLHVYYHFQNINSSNSQISYSVFGHCNIFSSV